MTGRDAVAPGGSLPAPASTARELADASLSANTRRAREGGSRRFDARLDGAGLDDGTPAAFGGLASERSGPRGVRRGDRSARAARGSPLRMVGHAVSMRAALRRTDKAAKDPDSLPREKRRVPDSPDRVAASGARSLGGRWRGGFR